MFHGAAGDHGGWDGSQKGAALPLDFAHIFAPFRFRHFGIDLLPESRCF